MTVKQSEQEAKRIPLASIVANTGQTRGMGIMPQLLALGYGMFEKASVEPDKYPIWPALTSSDPKVRKAAAQLIREHEPEIVAFAESIEENTQIVPISVIKEGEGYDILAGMSRSLALAFNHAEDPKKPNEVQAMVWLSPPKPVDRKFLGYASNNDVRPESPIDKALFFKSCRDDDGLKPIEIGKRIGTSDQHVRNHIKLLHPKLLPFRMAIHNGDLSVDGALKKLAKLKEGDKPDEGGGKKPSGQRARIPSIKKLVAGYDAKKKPDWMEQKEWELFVSDGCRQWLALRLGKKFKPFAGEVLTVVPEVKEEAAAPANKVLNISIPRSKAVRLLVALGKADADTWDSAKVGKKLENIVSLAEAGQVLEDAKLNELLQKLMSRYATGLAVTIKEKDAAAPAAA